MRRLYVGGLNHTVTQKDLKDRFGKFGEVLDVELRTRRDEEDVPYKTFAYININISEADLKKCMTVLNKSKWKGGTLQIEAAKESFLQRLAQERQEAAEHQLQRSANGAKKHKLLDTWSKAGVQNFTMKAAVPGSEVPGCKDWVVSKFGRVLPVLQLRCQKGSKARTVKYDPSKYCHNIRRLDRTDPDETLSVTQLTWQVEGGDDDISKRRRGEFPPYEPIKPKKSRTDPGDSLNAFSRSRSERAQNSDRNTEVHQLTNGSDLPTNRRAAQREDRWFLDSDVDSDEEVRSLAAAQQSSHDALQQEAEDDDNLEVVGLDYLVKSGPNEDEEDYDSAGTDELFDSRRNPPAPPQEKPSSPTAQQFSDKKRQMKRKTTPGDVSSSKNSSSLQRENPAGVRPAMKHSSDSHSDEDDEEEEGNSSDSSSDFDFPALFSANSNHLRISLADLQRLAEGKVPSILGSGLKPESGFPVRHARKEAITPDEILASILGEDSSSDDKEHKKKKKKAEGVTSASLQPSEETGPETSQTDRCLRRKREHEQDEAAGSERQKHGETSEALNDPQTNSSSGSEEDEEEEEKMISEEEEQEAGAAPHPAPAAGSKTSSSEEEEEEEAEEEVAPPWVALAAKEEEELQRKANMRRLAALQQRQKEAEEHQKFIQGALANLEAPPPATGKRIVFGSDDEEEKQEVVSAVKESKKPLFQDSQSEDEATADGAAAANQNAPHKAERLKPSGPQLFADSEDDEEGGEEEDGSRFDIRPEFEGPAGQKLMELQSRFGTDERFRMDSRFLEDEEEEEETEVQKSLMEDEEALEEEKKKNLSILQSVLGTGQQASGKTAGKAKQFRDVSALHYDPSKEEHAAFETKTEETKKESKAARRKKREEAQKLPEVSKEIYFQVSGDLKAVFGQTNDGSAEEEEGANWDKVEEEEGGGEEEQLPPSLLSADPSSKSEESSGFRFSFFGDESAAGSGETAEYKAEKMKAPKVSWHQDPRFHDSSSEEEEVEEDEEDGQEVKKEEQSSVEAKNTKEETPSQPDFFFFSSDDHRLKEGPKLFCRTSQLAEQREQWEDRTSTLKQEYRKKHRDARRKLNISRKT
ncbi:nucleolar protein 8 [Xiphophorus couchianus]|uniref:nucleolar protein 8 n=1 Tax=Xiphophorus couchianus TaxID=32473 RepID=UPI0010168302|nr:nucleolar protein 8 [Xiphophorus couchianus]XP_027858684.1 nucleolar protein 8 [Xiphophorus couchianus]XP_027858685.1 nucleolar protein 8 [Xiphophorus couchianus]